MRKRTAEQNRRLHSLLSKLGIDSDNKANMVALFTDQRTDSSSEMSYKECDAMIRSLTDMVYKRTRRENELKNKMRRNIFKLGFDTNLLTSDMGTPEKTERLRAWSKKKLHIDKHINDFTIDELMKFKNQLQAVNRNNKTKEARLAALN